MTDSIPHRAWRTSAQHRRLQQAAKKAAGLEPAEWSALCYLSDRANASSDELRSRLELQPGSLTNAIGSLRSKGLVTTTSTSGDKRARTHCLTTDGRDLVDDLTRAFGAALANEGVDE